MESVIYIILCTRTNHYIADVSVTHVTQIVNSIIICIYIFGYTHSRFEWKLICLVRLHISTELK